MVRGSCDIVSCRRGTAYDSLIVSRARTQELRSEPQLTKETKTIVLFCKYQTVPKDNLNVTSTRSARWILS